MTTQSQSASAPDLHALVTELKELRRRVDHLDDRQAILDCLNRYARAIDRHDWELLKTVYHPDGLANHGKFVGGAEDLAAFLDKSYEARFVAHTHHVANHVCEIEGDSAHVETNAVVMMLLKDGKTMQILGARYIDRFEKRAGEWKIALRRITCDWRFEAPALPNLEGFPEGRWGREDLAYLRPLKLPPELARFAEDWKVK